MVSQFGSLVNCQNTIHYVSQVGPQMPRNGPVYHCQSYAMLQCTGCIEPGVGIPTTAELITSPDSISRTVLFFYP